MEALCALVGAVVAGVLSLLGNVYATNKSANKTNALVNYRVDQLEIKVGKHNQLIERMYCVEKHLDVVDEKIKATDRRIHELRG